MTNKMWKIHDKLEILIPITVIFILVAFPLFFVLSFVVSLLDMVNRIGK
jgi:hypothetical protein